MVMGNLLKQNSDEIVTVSIQNEKKFLSAEQGIQSFFHWQRSFVIVLDVQRLGEFPFAGHGQYIRFGLNTKTLSPSAL